MLELQNPEDFKLEYASISGNYLFYKYHWASKSHEYYIRSELGGKQIFGREFGKGAKWERINLNDIQNEQ